ncbi:hypothetical protein JCM19236_3386 [Vibrio sp. JCM 19236]|nr:hypothetical protein JCM19236_3386 [Vibrio sp. JCM 19236]
MKNKILALSALGLLAGCGGSNSSSESLMHRLQLALCMVAVLKTMVLN